MAPGLAKLSYADRLMKLDLPTLVYRRNRGDAIEVYKYLHGTYSPRADSHKRLIFRVICPPLYNIGLMFYFLHPGSVG